jgi:hypothetical protein
MRKTTILAGIASLAIVGGMATPAFADSTPGQPVHSTVTIGTVLTLKGINPTVAFGTVTPGTTATVANAESPEVITNEHNVFLVVNPENGGYKIGPGQPDQIADSAVQVTTGTTSVRLSGGPVQVASVDIGDNTYPESWSLDVPVNTNAGDNLFADFDYSAVA